MENCVFCKIINNEIPAARVWEDKEYLAFLDANPVNPGHTILIPKKHTDYLFDLEDKEYANLMMQTKKVAKILKNKLNPKKVGLIVEGFGVPHVHVHLIPINKMYDLNKEKMKNVGVEELNKIAEKIRE